MIRKIVFEPAAKTMARTTDEPGSLVILPRRSNWRYNNVLLNGIALNCFGMYRLLTLQMKLGLIPWGPRPLSSLLGGLTGCLPSVVAGSGGSSQPFSFGLAGAVASPQSPTLKGLEALGRPALKNTLSYPE